MKKEILTELLDICEQVFPDKKDQIEEKSRILLAEYCKKEEGKPEEVTRHTVGKILPCIAFYKAVIAYTNQPEQAYEMINRFFTGEAELYALKLQKLCRIPFAYKLVPAVMAKVIHSVFGEKSGFQMIDHNTKGKLCHIDMIACPYASTCSMYDCPELTTVFCNSDDISYGNMHPKLSWERSKTIGRGNDCCDFIMKIRKK